jgi:hypothetical protein
MSVVIVTKRIARIGAILAAAALLYALAWVVMAAF